jgi:protein tyrosine phosphatase (PTP) superfamily phosphohydrolase (DUF442 family)
MLKTRSLLSLALALCATLGAQESAPKEGQLPESRPASEARYTKLGDLPSVQSVTKFSDRLVRGAQPDGAQGMAELKKLGVATILSVEEPDQPELNAAKEAGLKVINIPTEYNGFPDKVVKDLVTQYRGLDGTTYVHCHHGKHRGGCASAIFRITFEGVSQLEALQEMAELGASKRYPGLYETVRKYRPDPKTAHRILKRRPGIDGLIEVTPWIYRGTSQLNADAVASIKDLGVATIISTGMSPEAQARAIAAGLAVMIVAIDRAMALGDERQPIVKALTAKQAEKVFLHATEDPAQVAAMVGAFRIAKSLWSLEEAAEEAEALSGDRGATLAEAIRKGGSLISK